MKQCYFIIPFHRIHTDIHAEITMRHYGGVMSLQSAHARVGFSMFSELYMMNRYTNALQFSGWALPSPLLMIGKP